jgi:hypothetical protein
MACRYASNVGGRKGTLWLQDLGSDVLLLARSNPTSGTVKYSETGWIAQGTDSRVFGRDMMVWDIRTVSWLASFVQTWMSCPFLELMPK